MKSIVLTALFAFFLTGALAQPHNSTPVNADSLAREVKKEFLHSWGAYKKYAWGHDGLRPLSRTSYDWYTVPLYMTPVDALDTMILMGLTAEADSTREFIARNLHFDHDIYVKNFEITIRLLGGLLSSHQLTGDPRLLELAKDLGNRLIPAFISPTGMPYVDVNLKTGKVRNPKSNPGEVGTLLLEFGTLSMLTGDSKYYNYAKNAFLQAFDRRSPIGLVGDGFNVETGEWTGTDSHVSACIDSYYEYMIKAAALFDDRDCKMMWDSSYIALNKYILDSTSTGIWYGHADMNTGKRTKKWFGALDAFFPGTLVMAGELDRAKRLQESCMRMWNAHGIEPEQFDYSAGKAASPRFFLNPEIFESTFYLYRATGDPYYHRMGQALFDSLKAHCRVADGYTEMKNIITGERSDHMDSYFLAETLKYLYLLFAPPENVPRGSVFNTEAHPLIKNW